MSLMLNLEVATQIRKNCIGSNFDLVIQSRLFSPLNIHKVIGSLRTTGLIEQITIRTSLLEVTQLKNTAFALDFTNKLN